MQDLISWVYATFGERVDWMQVIIIAGIPAFAMSFSWEILHTRRRSGRWQVGQPGQQFYWKEILANLRLGGGFYVTEILFHIAFIGAGIAWVWQHRLFTVPLNAWTLPLIFLAEEFLFYLYHRSAHRVRWFWAQHVGHHTGEIMNMTTASRQSALTGLVGAWIFFLPPVFLGVHPGIIYAMVGANLAYQWFVHTEAVGKFHPWIEWLINTPSNHRVHHGRNPQYIDRNFGGVLMIYDHLFGSYALENEKVIYGIPRQIRSYNWFVLNLHEFVDMFRDAMAPGPLWQRLKHFWMPPEWERPGHAAIHTWTIERNDLHEQAAAQPEFQRTHQSEGALQAP